MKRWCFLFLFLCSLAPAQEIPTSYLLRTKQALDLCVNDLARMAEVADQAASRLAAGGTLWVAGEASFQSEFSSRAGGLMLVQPWGDRIPDKGDVVMFGQGGESTPSESLFQNNPLIVGFGNPSHSQIEPLFSNHSEELKLSPALGNIITAWVFTGELIGALTRLHKMPVVFETIGLYGGFARIDQYLRKGILWHEVHSVPSLPPEMIGNRYIEKVRAMLLRVEKEEGNQLRKVADWVKQTKETGKKIYMYGMGHYVPIELKTSAMGKLFETYSWNSGFDYRAPEQTYQEGDLLIHVGYQHPPYQLLDCARSVGARVVYIDILPHRDYVNDAGVIWIDPMWSWPDACVTLEGYDIPILPASGVVNGAIAWEIFELQK